MGTLPQVGYGREQKLRDHAPDTVASVGRFEIVRWSQVSVGSITAAVEASWWSVLQALVGPGRTAYPLTSTKKAKRNENQRL